MSQEDWNLYLLFAYALGKLYFCQIQFVNVEWKWTGFEFRVHVLETHHHQFLEFRLIP